MFEVQSQQPGNFSLHVQDRVRGVQLVLQASHLRLERAHLRIQRFVETKQTLGYRFTNNEQMLRDFVRFAEARNETFVRSGTALDWASASPNEQVRKLHVVHRFALWLHAEDDRHEVPHPDALGHMDQRRPQPYLISLPDIRKLLTAALSLEPAETITPLTWHYLFGLIAATGLRIGEALALTLDDITSDGLVIRDTKFGKSRLIALRPTSWSALKLYLEARLKETTPDRHLFVIATGRSPGKRHVQRVFRTLAEQVGLREPGAARGASPHSLRHSLPIRLTPMTATCRVPPLSRVKLGIGWSRGVARDSEQ